MIDSVGVESRDVASFLQRYGIRTPLVKGFTKFFRSFFRFFFEGENVCRETPSRLGREGGCRSVSQSVSCLKSGTRGGNKKLSSNNLYI